MNKEEFERLAYNYRSWPMTDQKGVIERYQELVDYVELQIMRAYNEGWDIGTDSMSMMKPRIRKREGYWECFVHYEPDYLWKYPSLKIASGRTSNEAYNNFLTIYTTPITATPILNFIDMGHEAEN